MSSGDTLESNSNRYKEGKTKHNVQTMGKNITNFDLGLGLRKKFPKLVYILYQ